MLAKSTPRLEPSRRLVAQTLHLGSRKMTSTLMKHGRRLVVEIGPLLRALAATCLRLEQSGELVFALEKGAVFDGVRRGGLLSGVESLRLPLAAAVSGGMAGYQQSMVVNIVEGRPLLVGSAIVEQLNALKEGLPRNGASPQGDLNINPTNEQT